MTVTQACAVLGVSGPPRSVAVKAAFRAQCKLRHPDCGDGSLSADELLLLSQARDVLLRAAMRRMWYGDMVTCRVDMRL